MCSARRRLRRRRDGAYRRPVPQRSTARVIGAVAGDAARSARIGRSVRSRRPAARSERHSAHGALRRRRDGRRQLRSSAPNSSSIDPPAPTVMTPPHTEQRARTPAAGTFDGSTRKTDRHSGQETFTSPPLRSRIRWTRRSAGMSAGRRVGTPIDREDRAGQRLRVALHFGRERADLRRVREAPAFVRHDADRHRHQWYTVKLSAAILAEEIAGATILLRVLKRNQRVEDRNDLGADFAHRRPSA